MEKKRRNSSIKKMRTGPTIEVDMLDTMSRRGTVDDDAGRNAPLRKMDTNKTINEDEFDDEDVSTDEEGAFASF